MAKIAKLIGWLLAVALGLLALLLVYLFTAFDPNDYRQQLREELQRQTGLEISLDQPLGWSIFPTLALELHEVQGRYPQQANLLFLQRARIGVDLPALLNGQLNLQALQVEGLELSLVRDAQGKANWQAPQTASGDSASAGKAEEGASTTDAQPLALAIESLQLREVRVSLDDQQQGQRLQLGPLALTAEQIRLGQAFPAQLNLPLSRAQAGEVQQLQSEWQAQVLLDPERQLYQLQDLRMQGKVEGVLTQPVPLSLATQLQFDAKLQRLTLHDGRLEVDQLPLQWQLEWLLDQGEGKGQLELPSTDLAAWLQRQGFVQDLPEGALKQVALRSPWTWQQGRLSLTDMRLQLDASQGQGLFSQDSQSGMSQLKLKLDQLNLDRYQASAANKASAPAATPAANDSQATAGTEAEAEILPQQWLAKAQWMLDLEVAKLQTQGVEMQGVKLVAKANQGKLDVSQLALQVAGGSIHAKAQVQAAVQPMQSHLQLQAEQVAIEQVLSLLGQQPLFEGRAQLRAALNVQGNSQAAWTRSLAGEAKASVAEGWLRQVNLTQQLCEGIATLNQEPLTAPPSADTRFLGAQLSSQIQQGQVQITQLQARLQGASAEGQGLVQLPQRQLDMGVAVTVEGDTSQQACTINPKFQGLAWPLRCQGSLDAQPDSWCKADAAGFSQVLGQLAAREAQRKAAKEVNRALEKQADKLSEQLGGEGGEAVKGLLKGLFGQ
ncbi:AsmA family protein [Balneatrix alpica]|uniref:AsmA family protein n=1 Tax=Balneatrix alpica TaxID=75684 RepID=A0ABV5ZAB0_9GAMM|nr:AsmA family protein [Balneatrix alpica]